MRKSIFYEDIHTISVVANNKPQLTRVNKVIRSAGLLLLMASLTSLSACSLEIFINELLGKTDKTQAAPPPPDNNGNFTDGDMDNMTDGGDMDNMTDGGDMDNMTDGGDMDNMTDGGDMDNMTDGGDMDNMTDGGDMDNMTDGGDMDNMTDGDDMDNMTEPDDMVDMPPDPNADPDRDGIINLMDVDDDGDGLIELDSPQGLDAIRFDTNGFSFAGITTGCGGNLASSASECNGYELIADIDMSAYLNWQPIGSCESINECPNALAFRSIFEGNNYAISNINIEPQGGEDGLGLFGSVSNSNIRNLIIEGLTVSTITRASNMGVIGAASNTQISNIRVRNLSINTETFANDIAFVGGLIGSGSQLNIKNVVINGSIFVDYLSDFAANNVGGLIGKCDETIIQGVAIQMEEIHARASSLGGIAGSCSDVQLLGSLSQIGTIRIPEYRSAPSGNIEAPLIGGLFGEIKEESRIDGSYSHINEIVLEDSIITIIGGLVGSVINFPDIRNSYSVIQYYRDLRTTPNNNVLGGVIGFTQNIINSFASYWDNAVQIIADNDPQMNTAGEQTTSALQETTTFDFGSIYNAWGSSWCNPETSEVITANFVPPNFIRLWNLGASNEYPTLNCLDISPAEQTAKSDEIFATNDDPVDPDPVDPLGPDGDLDGDGVINGEDVDDDGDGLIEISSAQEFDLIRLDLNGGSLAGVFTGCGDDPALESVACIGYELTQDISLSGFSNWQPIGSCTSGDTCPIATAFRSEFEGNGNRISNIFIEPENAASGLGLFGFIVDSNIRNLNINTIRIAPAANANNLGVIGRAINSRISNIRAVNLVFDSSQSSVLVDRVGGLVGRASSVTITNSSIRGQITIGSSNSPVANNVGGLVGTCLDTTITKSATQMAGIIAKAYNIGGLFGDCENVNVFGSSSQVLSIFSTASTMIRNWYIGGLGGRASGDSVISGTYSHLFDISMEYNSFTNAGGLIGQIAGRSTVSNSYAVPKNFFKDTTLSSINTVDGLVGLRSDSTTATNSYWDNSAVFNLDRQPVDGYGSSTTVELQSPIIFSTSNRYSQWANMWCNPLTSEVLTVETPPSGYIRLWDLGTDNEYPALNCLPFSTQAQRVSSDNIFNIRNP